MGFWKETSKLTWAVTKLTAQATSLAAKGVCVTAKTVYDNREEIKDAAKATADVATTATKAVYDVTSYTAKSIYNHRDEIGATVSGTVKGTEDVLRDASGHLISDETMQPRLRVIEHQSELYHKLSKRFDKLINAGKATKSTLLDTLVVGGETLAAYINAGEVPEKIQRAYELAYPHVAASHSYLDQIANLDGAELVGFVSGVKGKLFELQYVDYLNEGNLPEGYSAELASSPTNPGWDIAIIGEDGELQEVIQAKATDSASYVKDALEKNPHIDVVTTSEVHSHLAMQELSDKVIDGGITNSELMASIDGTLDDTQTDIDWMPSAAALALIAFSAYSQENLTAYQKCHEFGERSVKSYAAYLAGGTLAVVTGTWWIGVLGSMGSRMLLDSGRERLDELTRIEKLIEDNKQVLSRMSAQLA